MRNSVSYLMWILYAALSAVFAALVAIFGKAGVKGVDTTLATTIRACIMASFFIIVSLSLGKFAEFHLSSLKGREWLFIVLAGVSGALSWLFYFTALKNGSASSVAAIDRLSIVITILLAVIFLGESFTWKVGLGGLFMAVGAILIVLK